jgi:hypothetical protein
LNSTKVSPAISIFTLNYCEFQEHLWKHDRLSSSFEAALSQKRTSMVVFSKRAFHWRILLDGEELDILAFGTLTPPDDLWLRCASGGGRSSPALSALSI